MHHTQAHGLGQQYPFGSGLGGNTWRFSNLGLTSVNPMTGQYFIQFVPSSTPLNNNFENVFAHPGFFPSTVNPTQGITSWAWPQGWNSTTNPTLTQGQWFGTNT